VNALIVIGGGIVGLATAHRFLERFPGKKVVVLEKEPRVGAHQTGHNSGVLHSGIYYKPGSLKAANCIRGKRWMEEFCAQESIPFEICGKVIVAVDASEVPRLENLHERGKANGIACELVGPERLRELEPAAAGVRALHVPGTGIVDYRAVCDRLAQRIADSGGPVVTGAKALGVVAHTSEVTVRTTAGEFSASVAVNCAGLHSDRVLQRSGGVRPARIVPFRGEYYELATSARSLVRNLIYPVPDPSFPFLGVHFTRSIHGGVECGPNAVLAFAREGYTKARVNATDLWDVVTYRGFWKLASKHGRTGAGEMWRSFSKAAFVRALRRLVPAIRSEDLTRAPAGVRAQALAPDGALVDDFLISAEGRVVHVLNAPSPAATSSLSIGETVVAAIRGLFP
jgi:L-2-hydroxyglutarate oxidase